MPLLSVMSDGEVQRAALWYIPVGAPPLGPSPCQALSQADAEFLGLARSVPLQIESFMSTSLATNGLKMTSTCGRERKRGGVANRLSRVVGVSIRFSMADAIVCREFR